MNRIIKQGACFASALCVFILCLRAAVDTVPPVTSAETRLLEQAMTVSETNLLAAVELLQGGDPGMQGAAMYFTAGNFLVQMEHYEAAVSSYQEAIRKFPAFRDARKNLARVWLLLGNDQEAVRLYQGLVSDGHFEAEIFLLLGHGLLLRNHTVPAETAFRQVLMLEPSNQEAHRGLVQSLLEQNRFQEVRQLVRGAIDLDPSDTSYWMLLANVHVSLGDMAAAIRTAETARRLNACPPMLLMLLGDLYLDAERATEAIACYDEAWQRGQITPKRFLRAVEGLVMARDADRAAALLETIELPDAPDSAMEHLMLRLRADIAALEGNTDQAVVHYRSLVAADPLDGRMLLRLGDLLREQGLSGEALLTYERAGRLPGMEPDTLVRRARLQVEEGRIHEAVSLLERAQQIEPRPHITRYLDQLQRLQP